MNKRNLIVVIEDDKNNKFGCFVSSTIEKYRAEVYDENAFVFSLKNNGRIEEGNGMMKFNISLPYDGFCLCQKDEEYLFWIGDPDIFIMKYEYEGSYLSQRSFDYKGMEDVLIGRTGRYFGDDGDFTPKRIVVMQMN